MSRPTVTGEHMRVLRVSSGLTQRVLALRLAVRIATVSDRETGRTPLRWEHWCAACCVLGLSDPEATFALVAKRVG